MVKRTEYKKTVQPSYTEGDCQMRADCSHNSQGYHNKKRKQRKKREKDTKKEKGECAREKKKKKKKERKGKWEKKRRKNIHSGDHKTAHSIKIQFFFLLTAFARVFRGHGTPPACFSILIAYTHGSSSRPANSIGPTD